jgi:hypothetical protein
VVRGTLWRFDHSFG